MYIPADFEVTQIDEMHQLMRNAPLGIFFTHGISGLDANHLPFELQADNTEFGILHAHVSRNNPVWQDLKSGNEVGGLSSWGRVYLTAVVSQQTRASSASTDMELSSGTCLRSCNYSG